MKKQITKLSPHQNAKVFAILIALSVFPFILLMFLTLQFSPPHMNAHGEHAQMFPSYILIVFPLFYLILGYISVYIGCVMYNFVSGKTGGFEYESEESVESKDE